MTGHAGANIYSETGPYHTEDKRGHDSDEGPEPPAQRASGNGSQNGEWLAHVVQSFLQSQCLAQREAVVLADAGGHVSDDSAHYATHDRTNCRLIP